MQAMEHQPDAQVASVEDILSADQAARNLCAIWWEFEVIVIVQVLLVIIAVLLFGFIIFIHEFGHFMTAKLSGIRVNEFKLAWDPHCSAFKKGETTYALRLLPIGGFLCYGRGR